MNQPHLCVLREFELDKCESTMLLRLIIYRHIHLEDITLKLNKVKSSSAMNNQSKATKIASQLLRD